MKKIKIKNSDLEYSVGKILCVGKNYIEHAKEMGGKVPKVPMIFMKPTSTLIFNGDSITHPSYSEEMHHEVELVLLIGKKIKNSTKIDAEEAIIGYAVGLDMTLRDLQSKFKNAGQPWTLAKGFDDSAVVSDFVLKDDCKITGEEKISLYKNDKLQQNSTLAKMHFSPGEIVKFLSEHMTLEPGDLIFTGTPEGVSKVERGDVLRSIISGIAELENKIV
jgi:5-carboxymethyl-2-hydroxymuconate isomerase